MSTACGGDDSGTTKVSACPDPTLTYTAFGQPFIAKYCASCHGGSVTGDARMGAPPTYVFDSLAQVKLHEVEMRTDVVTTKEMPFGTSSLKPSDDERDRFGEWLDCGAPE